VHNARFTSTAVALSPSCTFPACQPSHATQPRRQLSSHSLVIQPLHVIDAPQPSPMLSLPTSSLLLTAPDDSVDHILLKCLRHITARTRLITTLASLQQPTTLTTGFITDPIPNVPTTNSQFKQTRALLIQHTNTFLKSINTDRLADLILRPLSLDHG
jgi:hypothetical protein